MELTISESATILRAVFHFILTPRASVPSLLENFGAEPVCGHFGYIFNISEPRRVLLYEQSGAPMPFHIGQRPRLQTCADEQTSPLYARET
jgi:hypothetical protein